MRGLAAGQRKDNQNVSSILVLRIWPANFEICYLYPCGLDQCSVKWSCHALALCWMLNSCLPSPPRNLGQAKSMQMPHTGKSPAILHLLRRKRTLPQHTIFCCCRLEFGNSSGWNQWKKPFGYYKNTQPGYHMKAYCKSNLFRILRIFIFESWWISFLINKDNIDISMQFNLCKL